MVTVVSVLFWRCWNIKQVLIFFYFFFRSPFAQAGSQSQSELASQGSLAGGDAGVQAGCLIIIQSTS